MKQYHNTRAFHEFLKLYKEIYTLKHDLKTYYKVRDIILKPESFNKIDLISYMRSDNNFLRVATIYILTGKFNFDRTNTI